MLDRVLCRVGRNLAPGKTRLQLGENPYGKSLPAGAWHGLSVDVALSVDVDYAQSEGVGEGMVYSVGYSVG